MAMPLLLPHVDYVLPMKIPFVNTKKAFGYWFNFFWQNIGVGCYGTFFGVFQIIFIIFSVHLLQELKVISKLCDDVGKYEKQKIIREILDILKNEEYQGGTSKSHIPTHHKKSFDHAFKEFKIQACLHEPNQVPSHILLKSIIQQHNEALKILELFNETFAGNMLGWEAMMACYLCLFYIMSLIDPIRLFMYLMPAIMVSTQYLIVSVISAFVKSGSENIGVSLYGSEWYWLDKHDKKTMLNILMLSQKPFAFTVGVFTEANLERFTDVIKMYFVF